MIARILQKTYRFFMPISIRKRITMANRNRRLIKLKRKILDYLSSKCETDNNKEFEIIKNYLTNNSLSVFPYDFQNNYKSTDVVINRDDNTGLLYTLHDNKRLFFKKDFTEELAREYYCSLQKEQDNLSPHRYLSPNFSIDVNDFVADIGCAEGIFALSIVEKVKEIYLFEADSDWMLALNATFSPWKEKVHIINKFVSDVDKDNLLSLDQFFGVNHPINFLKIDAEGSEKNILKGCENILKNQKSIKIALCTYHNQNDEIIFAKLLNNYGFQITYSDGYMIYFYDKKIAKPYLRKGLIRATKG
jgi:RNA-binding protein YhbY